MSAVNRRDEMLRILAERGYVSVSEFCELLFISEPTVRRELTVLENEGVIRRSHGGASPVSGGLKQPLDFRRGTMSTEKRRIAKKAAGLITDGSIIFLDTSTTAMKIIGELSDKRDITVVTNGLPALNLLQSRFIPAKCTGGDLRTESMGFVGRQAERFISMINADIMFFSTSCVSSDGIISDYSEQESYLRMAMLENSRMKVYLFDRTKFGKTAAYNVARLRDMDAAFTDMNAPAFPDCSCTVTTV